MVQLKLNIGAELGGGFYAILPVRAFFFIQ